MGFRRLVSGGFKAESDLFQRGSKAHYNISRRCRRFQGISDGVLGLVVSIMRLTKKSQGVSEGF